MTADNFVVSAANLVEVESPSVIDVVVVQGAPGPPGTPGAPGPSYEGVAWWFGEGPPEGVIGSKPGDWYLNTVDGTIFRLGD